MGMYTRKRTGFERLACSLSCPVRNRDGGGVNHAKVAIMQIMRVCRSLSHDVILSELPGLVRVINGVDRI
jgi:hypothetical protein